MIQLTIEDDLKLTGSEQLTLATRGYKMIKKVNEGSYAKVHLTPFQSRYSINAIQLIRLRSHRFISQNTEIPIRTISYHYWPAKS